MRAVANAIVAAAMKVFAKRGFAGTRVEDLLAEAGIARRTFYRYFTGKEDVLAAAYELAIDELLRAFAEASPPSTGPLADVRAVVDLYLDFHVENAALVRVLMAESIRSDSPLAEHRRRLRAHLLGVFARASETFGPVDGFTYVALVSALEGVALELLEGSGGEADVRRAKKAMHELSKTALGGMSPNG